MTRQDTRLVQYFYNFAVWSYRYLIDHSVVISKVIEKCVADQLRLEPDPGL